MQRKADVRLANKPPKGWLLVGVGLTDAEDLVSTHENQSYL